MAKLYEGEKQIKRAMECYEKAANCYMAVDSMAMCNEMLLKLAHFSADQLDYKKSIEHYEKVASNVAGSQNMLSKHQIGGYLYKASLVQFVVAAKANDMSIVQRALANYSKMFDRFRSTKECKFVEDLVAAFEKNDVKQYVSVIFKFDKVNNIDDWTSRLLMEVKLILKADATKIGEEITIIDGEVAATDQKSQPSSTEKLSLDTAATTTATTTASSQSVVDLQGDSAATTSTASPVPVNSNGELDLT